MSDFATSGVLLPKQKGTWKVVAYQSQAIVAAEQNYQIYNKKLLAVVQALEEWRHYLLGARHPVEIWTDHTNLTYFRKPQDLNCRQVRWSLFLSKFNFTFIHKPEITMMKVDALSQRYDYDDGHFDNYEVQLLKDKWFKARALMSMSRTEVED